MARIVPAEVMDRTMAKRSATSMDKVVGRNIRTARLARGLSQSGLAEKLGITFQQVQKYEKGVNRVGSGRLFEVAAILGLPVTSFFEEANAPAPTKGARSVRTDPLSIRLAQAFAKLPDSKSRLALVTMVESMTRMRRE
jgi:transcriptional regulator with XRE-family HTH domain